MRTLTVSLLLVGLSTLTGFAQTSAPLVVPKEAVSRLEEVKELTKAVAVAKDTKGKLQAEVRPDVNRMLVLSTEEFVRVTTQNPTKEAYLLCLDQGLARVSPLTTDVQDRLQVAEYYQDLLEIVGMPSSEGRLTAFAAVPAAPQQ